MQVRLLTVQRGERHALAVEDEQGIVTQIGPFRLDTESSAAKWADRMLERKRDELIQGCHENGVFPDEIILHQHIRRHLPQVAAM